MGDKSWPSGQRLSTKPNWKLVAKRSGKKYIDVLLVKGTEHEDNSIPLNLIRGYYRR